MVSVCLGVRVYRCPPTAPVRSKSLYSVRLFLRAWRGSQKKNKHNAMHNDFQHNGPTGAILRVGETGTTKASRYISGCSEFCQFLQPTFKQALIIRNGHFVLKSVFAVANSRRKQNGVLNMCRVRVCLSN